MRDNLATIQISKDLRNAIKVMAKKEKRTIGGLTELMIEERVKNKYDGKILLLSPGQ